MPCASRVGLLAKTRQTFFEHAILQRDLGDHLLQLSVLVAQVFDFVARGFAKRIARQLLLAGLKEILAPAVVEIRRDALSAAEFRHALLTAQTLEHDADLFLRCELPACPAANLSHGRFAGLLLRSGHLDTLLGAPDPVMCLLAQSLFRSECC